MNIIQISEDSQYMVQSNIDERVFQIQRMLADELDRYKGKDNKYVEENIQEIQELYKDEERQEKEGRIEDEEVILIKLYEVSTTILLLTLQMSFITEEVENLSKYMKFI